MATVQVVIASTSDTALPQGSTFTSYKYSILDVNNAVVQTTSNVASSVSFDNVAAGSYTATVIAVDQNGANLGTAVSTAFTVAGAPATFAAPATVTVTVS